MLKLTVKPDDFLYVADTRVIVTKRTGLAFNGSDPVSLLHEPRLGGHLDWDTQLKAGRYELRWERDGWIACVGGLVIGRGTLKTCIDACEHDASSEAVIQGSPASPASCLLLAGQPVTALNRPPHCEGCRCQAVRHA